MRPLQMLYRRHLERVRPRSPQGEEGRQADSLDNLGRKTGNENVPWALLGQDLGQVLRRAGGEEDQCSQVGGALVGQRAGGVDQGADAVGLQAGAKEGGAPGNGGRGGLFRLDKLLGVVGRLGAAVSIAEDRLED